MTIADKYLDTLRRINDWVSISEWAKRFAEMYPDEYEKAQEQAKNQANETTGLREIAARMSSRLSSGTFGTNVEIDTSEKPRKVKYLSNEESQLHEKIELENDIEPLTRSEIIERDILTLTQEEQYRLAEFDAIVKQLNKLFGLDFELDHAKAILNQEEKGKHHPNNIQILIKSHNSKKNNKNWVRFTLDEQIDYIRAVIHLHAMIASRLNQEVQDNILESLLERLAKVF